MSNDGPQSAPHDMLCEMAVLGSMLLSREALEIAGERLTAESFYKLTHQDIFTTLCAIRTADLILLRDTLRKAGKLEKVGGVAYLTECTEAAQYSGNIEYYCAILQEHVALRALSRLSEFARQAQGPVGDVAGLVETVKAHLEAATRETGAAYAPPLEDELPGLVVALETEHNTDSELGTGIAPLDRILGEEGLSPGNLVVISGGPSTGKSTLAIQLMLHNGLSGRGRSLLFSLEDTRRKVLARALKHLGGLSRLRGHLTKDEFDRFANARKDVAGLLLVEDRAGLTVDSLCSEARGMVRKHKDLRLIAVDYLQLLSAPKHRERFAEVSAVSNALKNLAKEVSLPVLLLSQVTVQQDGRIGIRWSHDVEQDADVIILLVRAGANWLTQEEPDICTRKVYVSKNRDGATGKVDLTFDKPIYTFREEGASHDSTGTGRGSRTIRRTEEADARKNEGLERGPISRGDSANAVADVPDDNGSHRAGRDIQMGLCETGGTRPAETGQALPEGAGGNRGSGSQMDELDVPEDEIPF